MRFFSATTDPITFAHTGPRFIGLYPRSRAILADSAGNWPAIVVSIFGDERHEKLLSALHFGHQGACLRLGPIQFTAFARSVDDQLAGNFGECAWPFARFIARKQA